MKLDIYTDAGGCSTKKIRIGAVVVNQDDPNYEGHGPIRGVDPMVKSLRRPQHATQKWCFSG